MEGERLLRRFTVLAHLCVRSATTGVSGMLSASAARLSCWASRGSAAVYLAAVYALREPRDCAIDERLGADALDHDQPDMPAGPE
jgi:hypothetical protein